MKIADRIANLPPYVFATVEARIAAKKAAGVDVISLGIGSPDLPAPKFIIDAMYQEALKPTRTATPGTIAHRRCAMASAPTMASALASADPNTEVRPLIGSKRAINMALAFVDPGDVVLCPIQAIRPIAWARSWRAVRATRCRCSGRTTGCPCDIPSDVAARATLLWLNYPNNPSGVGAPLAFLQTVDFCREYDILLCYDNPYQTWCSTGMAPSVLQIPEAKMLAVEFNSLSKTYNMAGWRVGITGQYSGHRALTTIKTNIDSGIFSRCRQRPAALTADRSWIAVRNMVYQRRRDIIMSWLPRLGMSAQPPQGGLYVWVKVLPASTARPMR